MSSTASPASGWHAAAAHAPPHHTTQAAPAAPARLSLHSQFRPRPPTTTLFHVLTHLTTRSLFFSHSRLHSFPVLHTYHLAFLSLSIFRTPNSVQKTRLPVRPTRPLADVACSPFFPLPPPTHHRPITVILAIASLPTFSFPPIFSSSPPHLSRIPFSRHGARYSLAG